jgi:NDP-sugar pyrophosphorylase family protein
MIRSVESDPRIDIVIPMAGHGSRFSEAGYTLPKPLIDVCGKPMIARVIENLRPSHPHRFIFVVLQQHIDEYNVADVLSYLSPGCRVVPIDHVTRGAAETVLMAEALVGQGPLVIANSDQWVDASLDAFYDSLLASDGTILTMTSSDPKWSYIERSNGRITRVIEKVVVSDEATVGIYGFREAHAFFKSARNMIETNDTSQGEFYVAPTYTYLVKNGAFLNAISIGSESSGMWGLGTPADLNAFLASEPARRLSAT